MPFFSVIIPMYNREAFVARALRSCLEQSFTDFEVVVVDDGSTDRSVETVRAFEDPRIRLVLHERNRGRCPARNSGMAAAKGEWFVFLDSDDELLPGALAAIHRRALAAGERVGGLRFMCVDERGTSPDPPHRDELFDYEAYVRWLDSVAGRRQEALPCARASTFPRIRYADSHAPESNYHLELARTTLVQACSDVVRRYHHDAADRIMIPVPERALRYAADEADEIGRTFGVHGSALKRWAPINYRNMLAGAVTTNFLAGRRLAALRYAARSWALAPFSPRTYAVVLLGLLGPKTLAHAQARRARRMRA